MKLRWSFRAANDRAAQRGESRVPSSAPKRKATTKVVAFFNKKEMGLEVGAVVNEAPVELQSRE